MSIIINMKLTAKVKLHLTAEQHNALLETLETVNQACNDISQQAWEKQVFKQFDIHRLVYYDIRERHNLSAQITVRAIAKVADAYKIDQDTQRTFRPHGAIPYDNRILRWYVDLQEVSIWTMNGRQRVPFLAGDRHMELLQSQRGESNLCYIDGEFYLFTTCDVETPEPIDVEDYLGVDLGIINIAVDSDGNQYAGNQINNLRERGARLRARLQGKGTKSAKRLLKKRSKKEQRFRQDVNHVIAKELVQRAKDTVRGIALEDLQGIRERTTVRKARRRLHQSWAFHDLRYKIEYKAELAGVPVVFVDPRNTSRTCPKCGYIDKRNRKTQSEFSCVRCYFSGNADHIAAVNVAQRAIDSRAAVTPPVV